MENSNAGKIVLAFFMVILGLVLIAVVANSSDLVTGKVDVTDEAIDISSARFEGSTSINITASNFTITNSPSGWKITECPIASVTWGNATDDFTDATDYNFYTASGILQILNTTTTGEDSVINDTFIDYVYCPDYYLTEGWSRSVLNLVAGFFALALLGIGLGLFYSIAKDAGIV